MDVMPVKSKDDKFMSVDVVCMFEDEMLNIGFFDFEDMEWSFHTDTLYDPKGKIFKWMYADPKLLKALTEPLKDPTP